MKRNVLTLLVSLFGLIQINYAQIEEVYAGIDDAETYFTYYLSPAINPLMHNMNNTWYTQADTHKRWGFDIQISASTSFVPEDEKRFVFNESEYNYLSLPSGTSAVLPTVAGDETNMQLNASNGTDSILIDVPDGIGHEWPEDFFIPLSVPLPMVQASLGLTGHTDVIVRFVPKSGSEEFKAGLTGIGVKQNLMKLFQEKDSSNNTKSSLSVLAAYTNAKVNYKPEDTGVDGDNQEMQATVNTYTFQAIGGYDLKIINFYVALGYTGGNTALDALGIYQYDFNENNTYEADETIEDPVSMNFKTGGFKTTFGLRLNAGPVKIFTDYTIQKYPSLSAGLAISIR